MPVPCGVQVKMDHVPGDLRADSDPTGRVLPPVLHTGKCHGYQVMNNSLLYCFMLQVMLKTDQSQSFMKASPKVSLLKSSFSAMDSFQH